MVHKYAMVFFTIVLFRTHVVTCAVIELIYKDPVDSSDDNVQDQLHTPNNYEKSQYQQSLNVSNAHNYATAPGIRHYTGKKWQVGRVSRKQYEIVNMLWRKRNIFNDVVDITVPKDISDRKPNKKMDEWFTPALSASELYKFTPPVLQTSTMSYIEFYYLDENENLSTTIPDQIADNNRDDLSVELKHMHDFRHLMSRSPLLAFRYNNHSYKQSSTISQPRKGFEKIQAPIPKLKIKSLKFNVLNNLAKKNVSPVLLELWPNLLSDSRFLQNLFMKNNVKFNKSSVNKIYFNATSEIKQNDTEFPITASNDKNITIAKDKIKFFEMYDSNTRIPGTVKQQELQEEILKSSINNEIPNKNERIQLEQVDRDIGHGPHNMKYAKKHAEMFDGDEEQLNVTYSHQKFVTKLASTSTKPISIASQEHAFSTTESLKAMWNKNLSSIHVSMRAAWFNYSFAAVYVYERFQVHCDAAAISPHWLVAAASCLSRHREDPRGGDRSAFVTYCGELWWSPERITYVKYTLIHPRYHPKDSTRRHLYNIGVIQVVTAMPSSCPNWSPIAIMSHQYLAELGGSLGAAVGWGLDRYDTSYASADLPRRPLSLYESSIYSNNCPGNSGYRNTKHLSEEAVANVYCLSLPPYSGEDTDPVHGGLLLVGGKLIALYLQEERRQWGEQSAQYTGIWRLVPWVLEVSNEPEEIDYFL